jgi:outer membrane protein OmpA-like peptidoglycan-associated protein
MRGWIAVLAGALLAAAPAALAQSSDPAPTGQLTGRVLDLDRRMLDVQGRVFDVQGSMLDLQGNASDLQGRVLDLSGKVLAMEVKEGPKEVRIELPADILFDFDKFDLRPSAQPALHQAGDIIRRARGTVQIDGHTDGKGAPAYNQKLSEQRADAVRRWLTEREGLGKTKFATRGFGASRPVAPNTLADGADDPDGRQRNRRVEIVFAK